jgi:replication-associated recombination protein RarA
MTRELECNRDYDVRILDGQDCSVDVVRDVEYWLSLGAMGAQGWKVLVVNEAHAMSRGALQKFLTLLERIPNKRLVLFTTTELPSKDVFGEFDSALASRCKVFTLAGRNSPATEKAFAEKARTVAQAEGLDGKPLEHYVALAKRCDCNLRRMYQQIEAGAMSA